MQLAEIEQIKNDSQAPISITSVFELFDYFVINDYVPVKVERVSNSFNSSNPISISLNGIVQGYLIFLKEKLDVQISNMTEFEFISFLSTAEVSDYNNITYKFDTDFLLIKSEFFLDYYSDYLNTSMLWGGFAHILPSGAPTSRYKTNLTNIEIGDKLKNLDEYSFESCVRAIEQPYAFERYLKLYHLLELQFDYSVISKIKNLSIPTDSNIIGKILNEYSNKELERLTDLIESYCTDISSLATKLEKVQPYSTIAEDMFIHFGKSKSDSHFTNLLKFRTVVSSGSFSLVNLQAHKVPAISDYNKFIINVVSYWIYRIRCSIAHNKIGEYHLSWNDENFIVDFGEPLLKEVLIQFFKK